MSPRARVTLFAAVATFLGSLSLLPIYDNFGWIPPVFVAVALVAATSGLVQRVRALAFAAPLAMLAVLVCYLTAIYAHSVALLGFIPGPAALRMLHDTLSSGFTDTTQLAAPVPVTSGLGLMTTGGVGLVAVVVETLASSLRRPAVAGLPLLAIFTVPAAILSRGVGWQPFVFASVGYLSLLLAEGRDRISRWGRPVRAGRTVLGQGSPASAPPSSGTGWPVGPSARSAVVTSSLTQSGRRVGALAVGIAVLVPVLIPGLHAGWFGTHHTPGGAGLGDGGRGATSISAVVSLRRDLNEPVPQPLFTYTTSGEPTYLRMITLDHFDGTQWTESSISSAEDVKIDKGIEAPAGVTVTPFRSVETVVTVSGLNEPYLPMPAQPTEVKARGDWLYNPHTDVVYSPHSSTRHLRYTVDSALYAPSATYLNAVSEDSFDASLSPYLKVPANVPAAIEVQADNVISAAHAQTAYQKAVALQDWFQSAFTYDITVKSGNGNSALLSFLQDKRGYCEQFAATMALMARLEGIPARVDVGFTPGSREPGTTGTYLVTTADAHAWPELYFPGAGWVRFEPTPRADGQTTTPTYATGVAPPPPASASASSSATTHANVPENIPTGPANAPAAPIHKSGRSFGQSVSDLPWQWLGLLAVLVVVILATPGVRWWIRRRRWTDADTAAAMAHAAWACLGEDVTDLGLDWRGDVDTPRRAAASIVATRRLHYDAGAQLALTRLARAEELARYSMHPELAAQNGDLRADELAIRRALLASVPRLARWRARVAPRSTARTAGALWGRTSESTRLIAHSLGNGVIRRLPSRRGKPRASLRAGFLNRPLPARSAPGCASSRRTGCPRNRRAAGGLRQLP